MPTGATQSNAIERKVCYILMLLCRCKRPCILLCIAFQQRSHELTAAGSWKVLAKQGPGKLSKHVRLHNCVFYSNHSKECVLSVIRRRFAQSRA